MWGKTVGCAIGSFRIKRLYKVVAALLAVAFLVDYINLKTGPNVPSYYTPLD